jgi:hypothetical protein
MKAPHYNSGKHAFDGPIFLYAGVNQDAAVRR